MNKLAVVLAVALVLGAGTSMTTGEPFADVALDGNEEKWFTTANLDAYGEDLDSRVKPGERVFSGHPAYVMESKNARLVFDRPRVHYYAITFRGTELGDRQYDRLALALSNGSVEYAIGNTMTSNMLQWEGSFHARQAFGKNYCAVDDAEAQALYDRTNATLYRYAVDCPDERQPDIDV